MESNLVASHKLLAPIPVKLGIHGLPRHRSRRRNLVSIATSSDLVNRNFTATSAIQRWVTDTTEHPTSEHRDYKYAVSDVESRAAVGWAINGRAGIAALRKLGAGPRRQ